MELASDEDERFRSLLRCLCLKVFFSSSFTPPSPFLCCGFLGSIDALDDDGLTEGVGSGASDSFLVALILPDCASTLSWKNLATGRTERVDCNALRVNTSTKEKD